jgi:hypothetical protein
MAASPVVALPMLALGFRPSEDDVTYEFLCYEGPAMS